MENRLSIKTGSIVIPVERDGAEVGSIQFNPSDTAFARRYFSLLDSFNQKQKEFLKRAEDIDKETGDNAGSKFHKESRGLDLLEEVYGYMKGEIDALFGAGTSETVFGGTCSLPVFQQFFNAISEYMAAARAEKMSQYAVKHE